MQYWLDLFTPETWNEAAAVKFGVTGFRETRWPIVRRVEIGDYFVCYLTRVSAFSGLLEAVSGGYQDSSPIWTSDVFPARVKTRPVIALGPTEAVPFDKIVSKFRSATSWRGYVRGSPMRLPMEDAEAIVDALEQASVNAQVWSGEPKGPLTARDSIPSAELGPIGPTIPSSTPAPRQHTAIQFQLIKLGRALGLSVHVARNDRSLSFDGNVFSAMSIPSLPQGFDPVSRRILELIDVLWLDRNRIVCAFEVEHSTDVHSGLLRMSDLLAVQAHTTIRLYLVAPDDRREKVKREINRPTFFYLDEPLFTVCKFIPYSKLEEGVQQSQPYLGRLKYEFIDDLAEICEASQPEVDL